MIRLQPFNRCKRACKRLQSSKGQPPRKIQLPAIRTRCFSSRRTLIYGSFNNHKRRITASIREKIKVARMMTHI